MVCLAKIVLIHHPNENARFSAGPMDFGVLTMDFQLIIEYITHTHKYQQENMQTKPTKKQQKMI